MRGDILKIQEVLLFIFYLVLIFYVIALGLNYIVPKDVITLLQMNMALTITSFLGLVFILFTKK
jgi:hypothetical protein